jgi:hypothetical protein
LLAFKSGLARFVLGNKLERTEPVVPSQGKTATLLDWTATDWFENYYGIESRQVGGE